MRRFGVGHLIDSPPNLHSGRVVRAKRPVFAEQRWVLCVARALGLLMVVALERLLLLEDAIIQKDAAILRLPTLALRLLQLLEQHLCVSNVTSVVRDLLLELFAILRDAEGAAELVSAHKVTGEEALLLLLLLVAVGQAVLKGVAVADPCVFLLEEDVRRVADLGRVGLELLALIARPVA